MVVLKLQIIVIYKAQKNPPIQFQVHHYEYYYTIFHPSGGQKNRDRKMNPRTQHQNKNIFSI